VRVRLRSDFYDSMLRIPDVDMTDNRKMIKIRDNVVTFFNEASSLASHSLSIASLPLAFPACCLLTRVPVCPSCVFPWPACARWFR